jgi:endonuclease IV
MAVQKNDYSFLKKFSLPIVIHAEHHSYGINIADISKREQNLNSLNFAIKTANLANSGKIIVHPGDIEKGNKNCSEKNAINLIKEIDDDRILMENVPHLKETPHIFRLCKTPEEIKKFTGKTKTGFCFDVNHALDNIDNFNGNYDFIKRYIKLNPKHYHIGGQRISKKITHLSFDNSDMNLREVLKYYPKDAEITLEVETDIKKTENDIKTIRKVIEELRK